MAARGRPGHTQGGFIRRLPADRQKGRRLRPKEHERQDAKTGSRGTAAGFAEP